MYEITVDLHPAGDPAVIEIPDGWYFRLVQRNVDGIHVVEWKRRGEGGYPSMWEPVFVGDLVPLWHGRTLDPNKLKGSDQSWPRCKIEIRNPALVDDGETGSGDFQRATIQVVQFQDRRDDRVPLGGRPIVASCRVPTFTLPINNPANYQTKTAVRMCGWGMKSGVVHFEPTEADNAFYFSVMEEGVTGETETPGSTIHASGSDVACIALGIVCSPPTINWRRLSVPFRLTGSGRRVVVRAWSGVPGSGVPASSGAIRVDLSSSGDGVDHTRASGWHDVPVAGSVAGALSAHESKRSYVYSIRNADGVDALATVTLHFHINVGLGDRRHRAIVNSTVALGGLAAGAWFQGGGSPNYVWDCLSVACTAAANRADTEVSLKNYV